MAYEIEKVAPDDPMRCSAITSKQGQCMNKATTPGGTCPVHGGNGALQAAERKSLSKYRLAKWNEKLKHHANDSEIKSLRDEIGILRMVMEERLNSCETPLELLAQSHAISDLVTKIQNIVATCHKLESSMGSLLDKQALLQFANQVISIISANIKDEAILNIIADEIIALLGDKDDAPTETTTN